MSRPTDIRPIAASVYFLPVRTRVPLKFGPETLTHVTLARVSVTVKDAAGRTATGWGETPLSVQWVWPSALSTEVRLEAMKRCVLKLAEAWSRFDGKGHPVEVGHDFTEEILPTVLAGLRSEMAQVQSPMPHLAALVCSSPFDIALHDAFGRLHEVPIYQTYNQRFMSRDLEASLNPAEGSDVSFAGLFPASFLSAKPQAALKAWHLVGGVDLLDDAERQGTEPEDGFPVTLREWVRRDGLSCLKVKLRGNDAAWDYDRLTRVGAIFLEELAKRRDAGGWLTADFNCTVHAPAYVNEILDRLRDEHPRLYGMLLYVEQPFPYELEQHPIDVHSVSARKPLFMDESAHDWRLIKLGRSLGWTGVALKTCKTQTGAILSACWAKAHGMTLMVQDLTNPMLAMIPHVLLAAHSGTIMGVEVNAMQFYPEASAPEEVVHPGLYRRRGGQLDLSSIRGPGFGYRLEEMKRELPAAAMECGG
jgi:L-alanine-DL-glutamate epimerase-like enolase superfamily enzyme